MIYHDLILKNINDLNERIITVTFKSKEITNTTLISYANIMISKFQKKQHVGIEVKDKTKNDLVITWE